jgi:hypothetical protein
MGQFTCRIRNKLKLKKSMNGMSFSYDRFVFTLNGEQQRNKGLFVCRAYTRLKQNSATAVSTADPP